MPWETLRAALDQALNARHGQVEVTFYGGEPLLEFPLIRRAVAHAQAASSSTKLSFALMTNGMVMSRRVTDFLVSQQIKVQLGFDGVPPAQNLRGEGTFDTLDKLLDRLRTEHTRWFSQKLSVSVTLSSQTICHLADSFEYLLGKGVREIGIGPLFTYDAGWKIERFEDLDHQFARIFRRSQCHYLRTGEVPLVDFRKTLRDAHPRPRSPQMCAAPEGKNLTVDVDGQVYGCVTFANSFQKRPGGFLSDRLNSMRLGLLTAPELPSRLDAYRVAAQRTGIFTGKEKKYSSFGRCGDCAYLDACMLCPVSIGHIPGNSDINRVSDLQCAYNLVSLKYRARFLRQPHAFDVLTGNPSIPEDLQVFRSLVRNRQHHV